MDYFETIKTLCEVPSASGFEREASDTVAALMERAGLRVSRDAMGNIYGVRKCGIPDAPCVILDAHFDEIGFIVTDHKDGFLKFDTLGGVDPRVLPAREVTVLSDPPMSGVISCLPPHILSEAEMDEAFAREKLYVDVGLSQEQAKILVPAGTPMVFKSDLCRLQNNLLCGRAMDDRAGLASLLGSIEILAGETLNLDVVLCASVQEEVGCRGATVAGWRINPKYALAVDVTHGTTPDAGKATTFDLKSGTSIGVGPNFDRRLSDMLISLAKDKGIDYTVEVCAGESGTNAWPLQVSRSGITTCLLSIPLRYMHTPCEVLAEHDLDATARLAAEFIRALSEKEGECNA